MDNKNEITTLGILLLQIPGVLFGLGIGLGVSVFDDVAEARKLQKDALRYLDMANAEYGSVYAIREENFRQKNRD
jgi:hypothetical protein